MNLYLLTQNTVTGYDAFDSCVVQANNEEEARHIHPYDKRNKGQSYEWADPSEVTTTFLGSATPSLNMNRVVCSAFNAG